MKQSTKDIVEKWMENSYFEDAVVLDATTVRSKAGKLMTGDIKINLYDNIIQMHVYKEDGIIGCRGESFLIVDDKKEKINGREIRHIAEEGRGMRK